jgi:hypothetical protein
MPDRTVRAQVASLPATALAALRALPEVAATDGARFVPSGDPRIAGQRAVAGGSTGVAVEWDGADAEGRPATLRAEVLLDAQGVAAGARTRGVATAADAELAKLLEDRR